MEVLDLVGAQFQIQPKVLLVHAIHSFYHCSIQELRNLEMNEASKELCVDGALKPEHQYLETKGLTHISRMPSEFQVKWIRIILIHVYNGKLWLDQPI